jgi:hypothetical protein
MVGYGRWRNSLSGQVSEPGESIMAKFRIETVTDPTSGLVYVEVYYPDEATTCFVRTAPKYRSHEEAAQGALDTMKAAFPDKPVTPTKWQPPN